MGRKGTDQHCRPWRKSVPLGRAASVAPGGMWAPVVCCRRLDRKGLRQAQVGLGQAVQGGGNSLGPGPDPPVVRAGGGHSDHARDQKGQTGRGTLEPLPQSQLFLCLGGAKLRVGLGKGLLWPKTGPSSPGQTDCPALPSAETSAPL